MKILDCTLRDGGYYTNWDFSKDLVDSYFNSFNRLPVDYLEIGYRSNPMKEYLGEFFYCPTYLLHQLKTLSNKKLAVMLNEKDVRPEHVKSLLEPCKGTITMVRIAVDPQNFSRAVPLAEKVKSLGFEVAFNVMYMSKWKEEGTFLNEVKNVDGIADFLYLVDSYGGVFPQDVINTLRLVREKTSCPLGFHGHNNIELALINSLTAIEHGAVIVDATITGMGRGAGNLKTELLLTSINATSGLEIDFNSLSTVVDVFEKLKPQHEWGTNLPYMISGANSLPQKDVMEWVTRRFYSFNSIIRALQNQKAGREDNEKLNVFKPVEKHKTAVIIGGGPNAVGHSIAVKEFIRKQSDVCIIHASSKNANFYSDLAVEQFFCLVGNEGHRLEKVLQNIGTFHGLCVLPPYPRKMGTYIPHALKEKVYELPSINFTDALKDSHTALALQTALDLGVSQVYLVGYDGYLGQSITQLEKTLSEENEFTFSNFILNSRCLIYSITPTCYKGIKVKSVYEELI
jgi:4-hydroxy 2-oxovalerate aldolase